VIACTTPGHVFFRTVAISALLLSLAVRPVHAQGPPPPPPPAHLWHADYTTTYNSQIAADQALDTVYPFSHSWGLGIFNSNTVLGPSSIRVTPAGGLGTLFPSAQPGTLVDTGSSPPDIIFSVPSMAAFGPGSSTSNSLRSSLPVAVPTQLGFEVTRTLSGGSIAAGASESRTFEVVVTPWDPTLNNVQFSVTFNFGPMPAVTAAVNSCTRAASPAPGVLKPIQFSPGGLFWEVTSALTTTPLAPGSVYTLTCNITVTNSSASSSALYMPVVSVTGDRTAPPVFSASNSVSFTTNSLGTPSDPLGTVTFDVTQSGGPALRAQFDARFRRNMRLEGVNRGCLGTVRIFINSSVYSGPVQFVVNHEESVTLNTGLQTFELPESDIFLEIIPPAGLTATPANAVVEVRCDATSEHVFTLADTTSPTITSVTPSTGALWPPNRQMVPVTIAAIATDSFDAAPACAITGVSSSESVNGSGDGNTSADWQFAPGNLTVNLRAERSGGGAGRTYTIQVTCTDASGNAAVASTTVGVGHDQRK
jgi:hypothetical protein